MQHSHVISLGNDCTTAFQLQYLGLGEPGAPFDWIVTPFDALIRVLDDAGASFGLEFSATHGWNVKCERYGVIHVHDFPKGKDGTFLFSSDICRDVREKSLHKTKKMLGAAREGNPLFVRYRGHGGPVGESSNSMFSTSDAERLHASLRTLLGHSRFKVLLVNPRGTSRHYEFFGSIEVDHPAFSLAEILLRPDIDTFKPWPDFSDALRCHL